MKKKRKIAAAILTIVACQSLYGGTGRPSDGLFSFLLLLGFLLTILGIIQVLEVLKKRIDHLLDGMY